MYHLERLPFTGGPKPHTHGVHPCWLCLRPAGILVYSPFDVDARDAILLENGCLLFCAGIGLVVCVRYGLWDSKTQQQHTLLLSLLGSSTGGVCETASFWLLCDSPPNKNKNKNTAAFFYFPKRRAL